MSPVKIREIRSNDGHLLFILYFANGERWISLKVRGRKLIYFVRLQDILDDNENQQIIAVDPRIAFGEF